MGWLWSTLDLTASAMRRGRLHQINMYLEFSLSSPFLTNYGREVWLVVYDKVTQRTRKTLRYPERNSPYTFLPDHFLNSFEPYSNLGYGQWEEVMEQAVRNTLDHSAIGAALKQLDYDLLWSLILSRLI